MTRSGGLDAEKYRRFDSGKPVPSDWRPNA